MIRVAFQGEHGAFSQETAHQRFGQENVEAIACRTFEHIFEAVESGRADYCAVPVENSTAGSIIKAYDLLLEHDLRIHAEELLRVSYCLMRIPGESAPIKIVRAHPQSLAQTEKFLNRREYVAQPWYDSAGAAKDLVAAPEKGVAIVGNSLTAEHYGLEILERGIEDFKYNFTRFFIVGKQGHEAEQSDRWKTSIIFAMPEAPGALHEALGLFASREINLTKIESRPRRDRLWQYMFYLDFDRHYQDPAASQALIELMGKAAFVKLLGSYPAAEPPQKEELTAQAASFQI